MMRVDIQKELDGAEGPLQLDIQMAVKPGEIIGIKGKSGEGKSSFLRMLAGLLKPDRGIIQFGEATWYSSEKGVDLSPQKRRIGLIFQDYALFPNMTVLQNMVFSLPKRRKNLSEAIAFLDAMELRELANKKPGLLSGGQQQRVALARALIYKPQLLLLDEAMAAVDDKMREKVQDLVLKHHSTYRPITIVVSHRVSELEKMADRVYELVDGRLQLLESSSSLKLDLEVLEIRGEKALVSDSSGSVLEIPRNWVKGKKPGDRIYLRMGDFN